MTLTVAVKIIFIVNVLQHLLNTFFVLETVESPFHALPGLYGSII